MYENFLPNLSSIISDKCVATPNVLFWILIALAKICFFHIVMNHVKIYVVLGSKFLKKPEYPEMRSRYAQLQKEAPSLTST